jgi:hypothetical protein
VNDIALSPREALGELEALLHQVSDGASPPSRAAAVRYMQCRTALIDGAIRPSVPGFLIQCISVSKFYDFIRLYHYHPAARREFVSEALQPCYLMVERQRGYRGTIDSFF